MAYITNIKQEHPMLSVWMTGKLGKPGEGTGSGGKIVGFRNQ